jgi:hypothetical protein
VAPSIICGVRQLESQIEEGGVLAVQEAVGHECINGGYSTRQLFRLS